MLLNTKINNKTYKIFFKHDFNIFIQSNFLLIKDSNNKIKFIIRIPFNTFYKSSKQNTLRFILTSYISFKAFITNLAKIEINLFQFFFFKLKLRGLGFKVRKVTSSLTKFFFTSTNFFYLHSPNNFLVKLKKKKLFFMSNSLCTLKSIMVILLMLKKLIVYKLRGLFYPRQIILMKPGKKRF